MSGAAKAVIQKYERVNRDCAAIILQDPERYAGIMSAWAQRTEKKELEK